MTPVSRVHLDLLGGMAGDMFVASLCHALPAQQQPLLDCLAHLNVPLPVTSRLVAASDQGMTGLRFKVQLAQANEHTHAHGQGAHDNAHAHVDHAWIQSWLDKSKLSEGVRQHAKAIFQGLAVAESTVHGRPVDEVAFHEVGAWDSIVDIVAAAFLIDAVCSSRWTHGPVPLGGGTIKTAHGHMPVPAPATALLMRGMPVVDDGVAGERVTPTGAAILSHLREIAGARAASMGATTLMATGFGFGTRQLPDRANALRVLVFQAAKQEGNERSWSARNTVQRLLFDVDDQSAEDLAVGLDCLRATQGVLQVTQMPVFGKKGRMATRVEVLVDEGHVDAVASACFVQTTTIGLRMSSESRQTLARRETACTVDGQGAVRVKLSERPGGITAKAEMDDLATRAGGHAQRERVRHSAQKTALDSAETDSISTEGRHDE